MQPSHSKNKCGCGNEWWRPRRPAPTLNQPKNIYFFAVSRSMPETIMSHNSIKAMAPKTVARTGTQRKSERIKRAPKRYTDEFINNERLNDDFQDHEHDDGFFDEYDNTFVSTKNYKRYYYDNVSLSGSDHDDDDSDFEKEDDMQDIDSLSARLGKMRVTVANVRGGDVHDIQEDNEDKLSYESSFVSRDMDELGYDDDDDYFPVLGEDDDDDK